MVAEYLINQIRSPLLEIAAGARTETRAPRPGAAPIGTRLITAAAFGMAVLTLTGCGRSSAQPRPAPPAVTVAPVEQKALVEWDEFTGRTEPVEAVEVRPRVSGYIQEVRFQAGQLVKKGEVLFVIDPRWHQAEYERRQAEVEQARVRLDNSKREADRTTQLLANHAISIEEGDARQARYQEAKAALLAAQAALDTARLDLDYTQVRAPIDGRMSRALLTEGNYVSGTAGAATLLTTLVSVDPVYVYADIDENSLLKFNALARARALETNGEGKIPVEAELADEANFPHHGYIESFDNRLDSNTGSILLRAVFPNADGRIVPGLFARIRLPLSERHPALLVEERALGTDQGQKFVLSLTSSNTVEYRAVTPGPLIAGKRIIRSGLVEGDKVVVNGLQRVRPGMPVMPQEEVASTPAPREPKLASAEVGLSLSRSQGERAGERGPSLPPSPNVAMSPQSNVEAPHERGSRYDKTASSPQPSPPKEERETANPAPGLIGRSHAREETGTLRFANR